MALELRVGDEATVRFVTNLYGREKKIRFRGVFVERREHDGSLTFWTPQDGWRSAPPDAEIVRHRKRTLPVPKAVEEFVDRETGERKD